MQTTKTKQETASKLEVIPLQKTVHCIEGLLGLSKCVCSCQ